MALHEAHTVRDEHVDVDPRFVRVGGDLRVPKNHLPDTEMDPQGAYQLIHDELMLDGNARTNLATFVTTWMSEYADRLFAETLDKNSIDKDEYPMTAEIERRCVNMVANLWNAEEGTIGSSAIGSSEAIMLAGLALKWRWRERMRKAGKQDDKPNLVMSIGVQVVWEKFCRYWDVEPRYVPYEKDAYILTPEAAVAHVDENTIGVVGILGVTYTGAYEPIKEICDALDTHAENTGIDVPVHVDAASGGFVAPFVQPDLLWDFRLPRVVSINASGHKYGLVYPGVGWVVWRGKEHLPEDLIFWVNYLGGEEATFTLNFSRPGSQIVAQYFNFLRLGFEGYAKTQAVTLEVAQHIASTVGTMGPYELLSQGDTIPVMAFTLKEDRENYTVFDVSAALRRKGWLVPAYTFPKNVEDLAVLRVVVRNGFGRDLADVLLGDLQEVTDELEGLTVPMPDIGQKRSAFAHGGSCKKRG
ncbi:MAG: glutamate decarboxylase [Coriobacteriales bacterium]|nr:glutamate decarboxylase [Coriobacteriales bacterium]